MFLNIISTAVAGVSGASAVNQLYGLEAIKAGNGWMISATGMLIVFIALAFISVIIALLPYLLELVNKIYPEPVVEKSSKKKKKSSVSDEEVVAITVAMLQQNKKLS